MAVQGKGPIEFPFTVPVRGYRNDLPLHLLPPEVMAEGSENVIVDIDGLLKVRDGFTTTALAALPERPMGSIAAWKTDGSVQDVVVGTPTKWLLMTSTGWTDLTPAGSPNSGTTDDLVRFTAFLSGGKRYIIGVNGVNAMRAWDGVAATYATVTAAPIAREVTTLSNRVVAGYIKDAGVWYPSRIRWSKVNDHTAWPALADASMADNHDPIVAIVPMDRLTGIIYRRQSIWRIEAVSGTDATAFRFVKLADTRGPVGPYAVIPFGRVHYYLAMDGRIWRFDGAIPTAVSAAIDPFLQANLPTDVFKGIRVVGEVDWANLRLVWWYPDATGTASHAIVYEPFVDRFQAPQKWANFFTQTLWTQKSVLGERQLLLFTSGGATRVLGGVSDGGSAIAFTWKTPLVTRGLFESYIPDTVELAADGQDALTVGVEATDSPVKTPSTVFSETVSPQTSRVLARLKRPAAGRFLRLTVSGQQATARLKLGGAVLTAYEAGRLL